jgi:hypothetical protein
MWELANSKARKSVTFHNFFSIANSLVYTGKALNFVLFCLSSVHFRRKLVMLREKRFPHTLTKHLPEFVLPTADTTMRSRSQSNNSRAQINGILPRQQYLKISISKENNKYLSVGSNSLSPMITMINMTRRATIPIENGHPVLVLSTSNEAPV